MATSNSLFFFFILLSTILLSSITTKANNIQETCKEVESATQNDNNVPPVNSTFCITSLQADPKSATASKAGLATIAIRLSIVNATSTKAKIDILNKGKVSDVIHGILNTCSSFYAQGIPSLVNATKIIGVGKYKEVVEVLDFPRDVGYNCDTMFFEGGMTNVVAKEGDELTSLVTIAQEILKSLG